MTLLAHQIRACLAKRILELLSVAATQPQDPWIGPPCSKVYLRQHQDVSVPPLEILGVPARGTDEALREFAHDAERERLARKARFGLARVVSVWEIKGEEIRELDPSEHAAIRRGELRVELHENAFVDFWTEAAAGLVHVDWVFGPSYGWGETRRVSRREGDIVLDEPEVRWESAGSAMNGLPFGVEHDAAWSVLAHGVRVHLLSQILAMMQEAEGLEEDRSVGPPCSRFYLRQREDVSGLPTGLDAVLDRKARFDGARVLAAWELAEGSVRALYAHEHETISHGAVREALYENAVADFWTEAEAGLVHVDFLFGPASGYGYSYKVRRLNGCATLEQFQHRWGA